MGAVQHNLTEGEQDYGLARLLLRFKVRPDLF